MNFQELNILVKFCSNRVDANKFREFMLPRYNDKNYIMSLWPVFRDNPTMFMTTRNETELFESIATEINNTHYKG